MTLVGSAYDRQDFTPIDPPETEPQTKEGEKKVSRKVVRRIWAVSIWLAAQVLIADWTMAQSPPPESRPEPKSYGTDVDGLMTVEKVSVLPFTDNLQGIYARPLESHFINLIGAMHRWDFIQANGSGPILSPEELEASPEKVQQVSQGSGADAAYACRIIKGPSGIMIHLSLFLTKDGKLLQQAVLRDYKQFDLNDLKEQVERLLAETVARLPYAGRILSRDGNRVTINLGAKDGIQSGQVLSVIQIVQAQRHPKFNFLVKAEKETFGKIKILKVDETLSFGTVVAEKEKGAVQKNSKIGSLDFVTYPSQESLSLSPSAEDALSQNESSPIVFGKNAHAWTPASPPTFGQLGARIGLGRFTGNTDIQGVGGLEGVNNFSPTVVLDGELWITPEWTFTAALKHGIISVKNPRPGGQPSELNQSMSYYEAGVGYTLRMGHSLWAPTIMPFLGYFNYRLYVDNSQPETFSTQQYSGPRIGVRGSAPLDSAGTWAVGGVFSTAINPSLTEAPDSSGASNKANVVQFGVLGLHKLSERLRLQANLDFEMYAATFTGQGTRSVMATSSSQRYTTLSAGVYYLF